MTINWYGHSCFKITNQGGHLTIITDPFDKKVGLNPPRGNADIVTVSHDHFDHNNIKAVGGQPFIINSPGEYETKTITINGISSFHDEKKGEERGTSTIYRIEVDGIRICHMGDFGQERLSDNQLETLGQVDILIIPVGGNYTINGIQAAKIANQIEPAIIIPMHYKIPGLTVDINDPKEFLKEMGANGIKPVDKLTLKKKDLSNKEMEVVMMRI